MRVWKETKRNLYLHEFLDRKASKRVCISCKKEANWRCLDCFASTAYCAECCRTSHCRDPFHRIERWTGTFYEPSWLWKVMSPYDFTSKTHSLSTEDLGKFFIDYESSEFTKRLVYSPGSQDFFQRGNAEI